jgi:hypothetical protein
VSDELGTFGGRPALIWKGVVSTVALGFAVGAIHFAGRGSGAIVFASICVAGGCYNLLWSPFEATLDREHVFFRSVAHTRSFNLDDLQRVKRHIGPEGSGTHWTFSFARGSGSLNGSSGERLARHLLQLKPYIANDVLD